MEKVLVLGAGLTGKKIAIALSEKFDVTASDIQLCSLEALSPTYPIVVVPCNFRDKSSLKELIQPFKLVINAASSSIGFSALNTIIGEKKNAINFSDFTEDIFLLDEPAKRNNVSVIHFYSLPEPVEGFISLLNMILGNKFQFRGIHLTDKQIGA